MQTTVILFTVLVSISAEPNGFYHQEYNYQTSSSSYKNHELQHRNDDQGYYSKDGDLEGRFRPRVNAHSQHSEYVNPKLQHGYRIGTDRTSSFGQLHAQNRYQFGEPGLTNPEMGGAYAFMGQPQDYGVHSNLREVTARLQEQIQRDLQRAVAEQHQRAIAYGGSISQAQIEADRRMLEEEMRRNVTMRMQEALKAHYGNQGIRGAYSYSIIDGRLQPSANYNNQELVDLTRQMEANLLKYLNQQVQTYYTTVDTQVHTTRNTYRVNGMQGPYPSPMQQRPPVYQPYPQPHPVPAIPDSITTVATRVQTELNEILNKILEDTQRRYFAENSFNSGVNYDGILARLQDELRANITFHFDDQIKRAYGYSNYISKYSVEDIENLRRQIETNLVTKLNRDFNRQRERYFQTHQIYMAPRPNHVYYPIPINNANPNYQTEVGMMQREADIVTMQRQLQEQLSRQLQSALMQQNYRQAHMYRGPDFNPDVHYQATLQQLSAELNRNLTRQIESLDARQFESGAYAAQLNQMRNQLQQNLMRQLQQGLQQSFSRYSSWSSSSHSSNTNYRPVRGFDPNVYHPEDCMMGDDPSASTGSRTKRSPPQQTQQNDDLTQQTLVDDDFTRPNQQNYRPLTAQYVSQTPEQKYQQPQQEIEVPIEQQQSQSLDNSDLTQQAQVFGREPFPSNNQYLTQQPQRWNYVPSQRPSAELTLPPVPPRPSLDNTDLTQQVQQSPNFQVVEEPYSRTRVNQVYSQPSQVETFQTYPQRPNYYQRPRQYISTYDWYIQRQNRQRNLVNQRVHYYENLGGQNPPPPANQYYQRPSYERYLPKPSLDQTQTVIGQPTQQFDNSDLTQQSQNLMGQQTDLTQQTQNLMGQQTDNSDLTQQSENLLGQQTDDSDLTQQSQNVFGPQSSDLTQQSQNVFGPQSSDLTQQYRSVPPPPPPPRYVANQPVQPFVTQPTQQTQNSYDQIQNPSFNSQQIQWSQVDDLNLPNEPIPQNNFDQLTQQQAEDQTLNQSDVEKISSNGFTLPSQKRNDLTQQTQDLLQDELNQYQQYEEPKQKNEDQEKQNQNLAQQTQDLMKDEINQYQQNQDLTQQTEDESNQYQQSLDLTQQNQQTEDVTQQSQENEDLTQQTQDLLKDERNHYQQNQDMTQQIEDVPNQYQESLDQQSEDFTQYQQNNHNQKLTQQQAEVYTDQNQQSQDLTQQTEDQDFVQSQDLTQQNQDLTQQIEDQDLVQSQDLTQQNQDLTQQNQDLTQQTEDQDLLQQYEQSQDLTQQTEDQDEIDQNQKNLSEAERESRRLIDLLKNQSNQQNLRPMSYSPRPVYTYHNGHPVQIGTTRNISPYSSRQVNYGQQQEETQETETIQPFEQQTSKSEIKDVEVPKTETTDDIQPIEPQVANEVESVTEQISEVTTVKPGWWSKFKTSITNRLG